LLLSTTAAALVAEIFNSSMIDSILLVDSFIGVPILSTSSATVEKPLPFSQALSALLTAALSAKKFV
jgi:hypothetical protein